MTVRADDHHHPQYAGVGTVLITIWVIMAALFWMGINGNLSRSSVAAAVAGSTSTDSVATCENVGAASLHHSLGGGHSQVRCEIRDEVLTATAKYRWGPISMTTKTMLKVTLR